MSLATRCPQCQTVFRVVPDQLRVSEGWVRCGRCTEVFNAAQHLVDPATGETRRAPIEVHSGLPPPVESDARDRAASAGSAASAASPASSASPASPRLAAPAPPPPPTRPESASGMADFADSEIPDDEDAIVRLAPSDDWDGEPPARAPAAAPARHTRPGELPSFVQRARRAERWRSPGVRFALGLAVLVGVAALAAQGLLLYRDHAAARWPALKPLLVQLCAGAGCRIQPLRAIEALAVDSSGLLRVEKSDLYKLGVTLRNRRELEVALPAIDLALTDTRGQLIARRVLRPSELGAAGATLAGRGELALQATIRVEATPVAGYTIELFYP